MNSRAVPTSEQPPLLTAVWALNKLCGCLVALALLLLVSAPAAEKQKSVSTLHDRPKEQNQDLRQGLFHLAYLQSDRAIAAFTPELIAAAGNKLSDKTFAKRTANCLLLIGRAFLVDENEPAASQALSTAQSLDPDNLTITAFLAEALSRQGRIAEAVPLYAKLAPLANQKPIAAKAMALRYFRQHLQSQAIPYLKQAELSNPKDAWTQSLIGKAFQLTGLDKEASKHYRSAAQLELNPYSKQLFLAMADTLSQHPVLAQQHLRLAGNILTDDPLWRTKLAHIYFLDGEKADQSKELLRQAVSCRRLYTRAFTLLGLYLAFHNQRAAAFNCFNYAQRLRPWSAEVYTARGQAYELEHDDRRAEAEYKQAIAVNPEHAIAYYSLSRLYSLKNKPDLAFEVCQRCLEYCPGYQQAWLQMGDIERGKGNYQKALADYRQALGPCPEKINEMSGSPRALLASLHARIGSCYLYTKQDVAALAQAQLFNKFKDISKSEAVHAFILLRPERLSFPESKSLTKAQQAVNHVALADMLLEAGDLDNCCAHYRKALELDPNNINWHMCLLNALIDKKDWAQALKEDIIIANKLLLRAPEALSQWQKIKSKAEHSLKNLKPVLAPQN